MKKESSFSTECQDLRMVGGFSNGNIRTVSEVARPAGMFNGNANNGYSFAINSTTGDSITVFRQNFAVNAEWVEGPCHIGFKLYVQATVISKATNLLSLQALGT